jgi:hypothetical protein
MEYMKEFYINDFNKIINNTGFNINFISSNDNCIQISGNEKIVNLISFTQEEKSYIFNIFSQKQTFELNNNDKITINIFYQSEKEPIYVHKKGNKYSKNKKLPYIVSI